MSVSSAFRICLERGDDLKMEALDPFVVLNEIILNAVKKPFYRAISSSPKIRFICKFNILNTESKIIFSIS